MGLALTGVAAAGASPAVAADLWAPPALAPEPYDARPALMWSGVYVGGNLGAAWTQAREHETSAAPFNGSDFERMRSTEGGFTGGGQIGYNVQWGHVVAGIEADFNYIDRSTSVTSASGAVTANTSGNFIGTIRPRLGYAAGPWLFYGTGGFAYGDARTTINGNTAGLTAASSDWRTGWVLGGGIEYALNRNWSVRTEYLHTDLGGSNAVGVASDGNTYSWRTRVNDDSVRFGLNYRF